MITITIDVHNYSAPPPGTMAVVQVADYVPVRIAIRQALDSYQALSVYVTHPTVLHWLDDLRQYPSSSVRWQYVDPTQAYTALFGLVPSGVFSPELIKQLELESLPQPQPGSPVDPISWILGQKLKPIWGYIEGSQLHIAELVASISEGPTEYPSFLVPLIDEQLRKWSAYDASYQALHSMTLVDDAKALIYRWAFQHYESRYLTTNYSFNTPLMTMGHTQAGRYIGVLRSQSELIRSYWSRWFAETGQNTGSIRLALRQMSGWSIAELSALKHIFDQQPELLTLSLWNELSTLFSHLPDARATLRNLAQRIAPNLPKIPDKHWDKEQYLRWATQEYMPYFSWIIRHKQDREHQQICAKVFSDWLIDQYPSWLNSSTSPVVLNNYGVMRQILDTDPRAVILWLIIDGLTWWQGTLLHKACESQGLHLQMYQPNVAALPSITTISKRVLITGITNADPMLPIASVARVQLGQSGIPHVVSYDRQEVLNRFTQDDPSKCYVFLDNMIDTIAHQTADFTDNRAIQGHLEDIAELAGSMYQRCEERGRNFHVLIGSDHGSTLLPRDAAMLPLPRNTHEIAEYDEADTMATSKPQPRSTRAVSITELSHLSARERETWYVLDKDRYQLADHYIVPQGYHYVSRRPSGWTHGGLTPEEVVVPFMHMTAESRRVESLQVRVVGGLQAYQPSELIIEVINANIFPFEGVTLTLSNPSMLIASDRLNPTGVTPIHVSFPAIMTDKSELVADWRLEASIFGSPYSQQGQVSIGIRRLQVQDDLDGFFSDT